MNIKDLLKNNRKLLRITSLVYNCLFRNKGWHINKGNSINIKGSFLKNTTLKLSGGGNMIRIGEMARLNNCLIFISGNGNTLTIGRGHTIVNNAVLWIQGNDNKIEIGQDFTMESGHIASTEGNEIIIGNDCMFSNDIEIRNGDSHSILDLKGQRINYGKSVQIGNHVWLCAHVRILKGVSIVSDSIIGNSSVVTKNCVETNSIYAGFPAKRVKDGITWNRYLL